MRQMNVEIQRRGWSDTYYRRVVRHGFVTHLQANRAPHEDEPRITTPQWAMDRAAEIGAAAAEKVAALGVRIVGDISTLGAPAVTDERAGDGADIVLEVDAAREAVVGAMLYGGVDNTPGKELLRATLSRAWSRARGRGGPAERPMRSSRG